MKAIHYVLLACTAIAAGLPGAEAALPPSAVPWAKALGSVCVLLAGALGLISGSAAAPSAPAPALPAPVIAPPAIPGGPGAPPAA